MQSISHSFITHCDAVWESSCKSQQKLLIILGCSGDQHTPFSVFVTQIIWLWQKCNYIFYFVFSVRWASFRIVFQALGKSNKPPIGFFKGNFHKEVRNIISNTNVSNNFFKYWVRMRIKTSFKNQYYILFFLTYKKAERKLSFRNKKCCKNEQISKAHKPTPAHTVDNIWKQ